MGSCNVAASVRSNDRNLSNTRNAESQPAAASPFADFIIHTSNELAAGVVGLLAEGRTEGFSPLLLVGESGTGKTRIIELMLGESVRRRPEMVITKMTGNELRTWVADLRRTNVSDTDVMPPGRDQAAIEDWSYLRSQLREADLLVIDGLEDLAGNAGAVAELEYALESLFYRNAAIVFTCRSLPKAGDDWSSRFLARLASGLVVRMGLPDDPARRRFIMNWAADKATPVDPAVVDQLAAELLDFGTLKGRLEQMRLMSKVNRKPIVPELVASMIESRQVLIDPVPIPTIKEVAKIVAKSYRITLTELRGPSRLPGLVRPRHVAIWLAHKLCGISNEKICTFFGGRDPATIRHAVRQIEQRRAGDFVLEEQLTTLISKLTHMPA